MGISPAAEENKVYFSRLNDENLKNIIIFTRLLLAGRILNTDITVKRFFLVCVIPIPRRKIPIAHAYINRVIRVTRKRRSFI